MKDAVGAVQRVLVLGGDSDIANALIKRLAKGRTRSVILAGRDTEALERRAQHWREHGLDASTLSFDALEFESHPEFVERAFADGDIDLVFVAFGVLGDQKEDERDPKKAVQVIQANFTGAVSVMIPLVERLKTQGHGTVAVMSSVAAERPRRSNFIYGASKAGIDWFSQGLGDALQGSGVHVMVVRAGFARSKMTEGLDTPPMASTPDEVAAAIVDGLRKNREIVWVPGKLRWVMSVLRHLPRPIFRKLNI